jgi:hypothetical protein
VIYRETPFFLGTQKAKRNSIVFIAAIDASRGDESLDYLISGNGFIVVQIMSEDGDAQLLVGARIKAAIFAKRAFDGCYHEIDEQGTKCIITCKCSSTITISANSKGYPRLSKYHDHLGSDFHLRWMTVGATGEAISDEDDQDRHSTTNNEVYDTSTCQNDICSCFGNLLQPEMAIRTCLLCSFVLHEDFFFFDDFHARSTLKLTRFKLCDLRSFFILFSDFFPLFVRTIYCHPIRLSKVTGGFGSKKCPCFIESVFARVKRLPQWRRGMQTPHSYLEKNRPFEIAIEPGTVVEMWNAIPEMPSLLFAPFPDSEPDSCPSIFLCH